KELTPLAPDLWPRAGFNITVNDSDGTIQRKGRLELRPKNMTMTKRTEGFAALAFAPSPRQEKLSAAVLWRKRATEQDGTFRAVIAARSPQARAAQATAVLASLDSP